MPIDASIYNSIQQPNQLQNLAGIAGIKNAMQQNQLQKLEIARTHYQNLQELLAPMANDPVPTQKKMIGILTDGISQGLVTPQQAAMESANWGDDTPDSNKKIITDHLIRAQSAAAQLDTILGKPAQVNTGGQVVSGVQASPLNGGGFQPATAINNTLPPTTPTLQGGQKTYTGSTPSGSVVPTGDLSPKQQESQGRLEQVHTEASSAPQNNAVLEQIERLSKSGAPTGTVVGQMYQYLSSKGIAPQGVVDKTQQLQEVSKYMEQAAIAGGIPNSDARLAAVQNSNTHPDQLPGTIQNLIPFLKATNNMKLAKQHFYNQQTKYGADLSNEPQAKEQWDNNADPRLMEYAHLPDAESKGKYLDEHPEVIPLISTKLKSLKKMGILGQ